VGYDESEFSLASRLVDDPNDESIAEEKGFTYPCLVLSGMQLKVEIDAMNIPQEGKFPLYAMGADGVGTMIGRIDLSFVRIMELLYTERFSLKMLRSKGESFDIDNSMLEGLILT
jgi:hypothetical protein